MTSEAESMVLHAVAELIEELIMPVAQKLKSSLQSWVKSLSSDTRMVMTLATDTLKLLTYLVSIIAFSTLCLAWVLGMMLNDLLLWVWRKILPSDTTSF